jgi:hypothetical protein
MFVVLGVFLIMFGTGFGAGYGVRASISRRRRRKSILSTRWDRHFVRTAGDFATTKEQVQNIQDAQTDGEDGRERSTIKFPYNDLNSAIEIAKAIQLNAGMECTLDQLVAYLRQSMTSGAFRLRVSAAATFGLTENERGKVKLTTLGRRIADPAQEAAARADAFLTVPLYSSVYENFKGYTLPGAAAIEKYMRDVGVSSKQLDKARQVFLRSARQANFFEHGEDRLVRPAVPSGPGTPPVNFGSRAGIRTRTSRPVKSRASYR